MAVRVALPGARTDVAIAMPGGPIDALLTMVPPPTMATAGVLAMAGMVTVAPATAMAGTGTVAPAMVMADMATVALALDSVSASDAVIKPPGSRANRANGRSELLCKFNWSQ